MTRFLAKQLSTPHWFDIGAARRDFGYRPSVSIDEGMEQLAVWLRSSGVTRHGTAARRRTSLRERAAAEYPTSS